MSVDFEKMMEQHFADDNKHFGELNRKTDKLSEQMTQNGEHFSYFSKNLVEINAKFDDVKDTLKTLEDRYSNREVDVFFKEIGASLGRIEAQTIKTNGRVTKVEGRVDETDKLVFGVKMTTWVASSFISLVLALIGYVFITQTSHTQDAINELKASIKKES